MGACRGGPQISAQSRLCNHAKAGVPVVLHVFEKGPHGVGLAMDDPALAEWSRLLTNWLRVHAVIK